MKGEYRHSTLHICLYRSEHTEDTNISWVIEFWTSRKYLFHKLLHIRHLKNLLKSSKSLSDFDVKSYSFGKNLAKCVYVETFPILHTIRNSITKLTVSKLHLRHFRIFVPKTYGLCSLGQSNKRFC